MSRGHREHEVLDGYSVAKVLNYSRAARLNRRLLATDLAVGVSLGIRDAFATEGKLVQTWAQDIEDNQAGQAGQAEEVANPLSPWTKHLPVVKVKRKQ